MRSGALHDATGVRGHMQRSLAKLRSPGSRTCREQSRVLLVTLSNSLSRRGYVLRPNIGHNVRISVKQSLCRDIAISTVVRNGPKAYLVAPPTRRRTGRHRGAVSSLRRSAVPVAR
jgi:hypothetical protein